MRAYIIRRLLLLIPTLFFLTILVFLALRFIPGDVIDAMIGIGGGYFGGDHDTREALMRDVCALLPHAAVRVYVMGARALALEPATADDIARMREITAAAVRAGAFGVSTSRTTSHRSLNGEFIPTLRAYEDELQGLALGVRDGGRGLLEVVTEWVQPNPAEEFAMLCRIAERSRLPVLYSLTQYHEQPPGDPQNAADSREESIVVTNKNDKSPYSNNLRLRMLNLG